MLDRHLPNNWSFGLPVRFVRIRPDLVIPVFADDDVSALRDPAMAAAMRLLAAR